MNESELKEALGIGNPITGEEEELTLPDEGPVGRYAAPLKMRLNADPKAVAVKVINGHELTFAVGVRKEPIGYTHRYVRDSIIGVLEELPQGGYRLNTKVPGVFPKQEKEGDGEMAFESQ